MPPLILWLSGGDTGGKSSTSNAEAQAAAATALLSMVAGNEMLQALIAQSNGIPPLIELVEKGSNTTQAAAARLLWHLAGNEAAGLAISAAGGMQPLCVMLSSEVCAAAASPPLHRRHCTLPPSPSHALRPPCTPARSTHP